MSVLAVVALVWLGVLVLVVASIALEAWTERETKGGSDAP